MKQYTILLLLAVAFTACEDFLTREPSNEVSKDQIFSDIAGAEMAMNGVYRDLSNDSYFYRENILMYAELKGGNIKYGDITSAVKNGWLPSYEFTPDLDDSGDDDMYSVYSQYYKVLYAANAVIEGMAGVTDGTEQQRNQIYAEALTLRALIHADLAKLYAKPWVDGNGSQLGVVTLDRTIDSKTFPARATLAETYAQIESDLLEAIDLYDGFRKSATDIDDFEPRAFATQEAAEALLARAYLNMGEYTKAVEYATYVIESSDLSLIDNEDYISEWERFDYTTDEDIFVLDMSYKQTKSISTNYGVDYSESEKERVSNFSFTEDLLSLYGENDVRSQLYVQNYNGDIVTKKYVNNDTREEYRVVIRLSEMYLLRAEAASRNNDDFLARIDLETIRNRANPDAEPVLLHGQELRDEIMAEKRRELAGEGHLFYDMIRTQTSVVRSDYNGTDNQDLPSNDYRMILPIPEDAMSVNDQLIQNEGYN